MHTPQPLTHDLVLIGGGHTHALALRKWGMRPVPGIRLTLINPDPTAPYTGMLPGLVAGHYNRDTLEIDLVRLARFAGARLVLDRAVGMDRAAGRILLADGPPLRYDIASLDIGITAEMAIPGFEAHAIPAKPLGPFATAWEAFLQTDPDRPRIAIIGGGVAGAELAMAMAHRLRDKRPDIHLLEAGPELLRGLSRAARSAILDRFAQLGVTARTDARVVEVTPQGPILADGTLVEADLTVGAAGATPHGWLAETGLETTDGFVAVDAQLRSISDPRIYAAGDCAHLTRSPRPKAGVYAVRAAPILAWNLAADLTGRQRRTFRPQRDFLKLISLGDKSAVAQKWGFGARGKAIWRWKDRIDRAFMQRFVDLPQMDGSPDEQPPCAGCGAKVGAAALTAALSTLPPSGRPDVRALPGDDAALLEFGTASQVITTDHLRGFTPDHRLLAEVAAQHALGDVWAMGARPQAALASIILPHMADRQQEATLTEIMTAAGRVFAGAGADMIGGHTTLGAELTIGFTITGLLEGPPKTLAGAKPGDALILTKAIGSGTILAAEMALKARGGWVAEAWAQMTASQQGAADALRTANAMTDVTGFGLAGHLMNMMRASGTAAHVILSDIPLLPGAAELAEAGVRSTLYPANAALADVSLPDRPQAALMFDPQTSGGLLASVPGAAAAGILSALTAQGYAPAIIGMVVDGPPRIEVT